VSRYLLSILVVTLLLAPSFISSGTWQQVKEYPEGGCNKVPRRTMCLSACAFAWLKGSKRVNEGILGFHMPYNPETWQTSIPDLIELRSFLHERGSMWLWNDLMETSPSKFIMILGSHVWVGEWKDIKSYKVTSSPYSLEKCD
jgi:hypothetical protein